MSDLEEMDSERLNELESILYASIHYNDASEQQQQQQTLNADMDAQSMPPPPQQPQQEQQQQQQQRFVSDKRIINNAAGKPRYWTDTKGEAAAVNNDWKAKTNTPVESATTETFVAATEQPKAGATVNASPKNKRPDASGLKKLTTAQQKQTKVHNPVQKLLRQQQPQMRQQPPKMQQPKKQPQVQKPPKPQETSKAKAFHDDDDEPERFDQRLLVAIPCNLPVAKREPAPHSGGPFGKANRKLEQFQRLAEKREKSKRVQANKKLKANKGEQPMELIDLVDSEKSSDADDVMIVPLPPVPIIDVDASDEESCQQPYLEENAMDAADVSLVGAGSAEQVTAAPQLHSPCSSVLSSDDFIVQKDTSRLIAERARATDEDLLVLTENAIRDAAEPAAQADRELAADTSSEYEFVPPSRLEEIKQNYRVDEQQFRALDVYESESDLTESGVYCKAKQKIVPTIIRNVDSESDTSDVEQVVEVCVNKTKRLRKRRASSTNQSQSDPNNEGDRIDDDTDSDDDGVQATGVPGIARGMAVERCKRKIRRVTQRRSSESAVTAEAKKTAVENASSESAAEESLPTARQIAERLLQQEQDKEQQQQEQVQAQAQAYGSDEAMDSVGSDANTEDEAEMHNAMTERISAVFERIDNNTRRAKSKQSSPEKQEVITTESELVPQADEAEQQQNQLVTEENNAETELVTLVESEPESDQDIEIVEVGQKMSELKDVQRGGDLVGWNDEMCRFYNDSWHGEHFNLQKILKTMSGHRSEWRIINADRFPVARKRSNLKCNNCFEMGHMRSKCPRPRKPVVCYTCGMTGHAEPRCPNAICLGCGAKQSLYVQKCNKCSFQSRMVCQLCKMRGHSTDMCPDKWRRYHSTTRSNCILESNVQYRTKHCSYCSARGHLFEECRQRMGEYRNTNYTTRIISHQKVYKDRSGPVSYPRDVASFFAIDTPFHFNWSSEFSKNSCYARFLKAVGLARPADKRKKSAPALQMKVYTNDYVPNPHARAALGKPPAPSSVIIEELPNEPNAVVEAPIVAAPVQTQQEEITSNYQSNSTGAKSETKPSLTASTAGNKSSITPHDLDSDSNYSFSEHFEVPSSTTTSNEAEQTEPEPAPEPEQPQPKTGPMENLPDIILLSSAADGDDENGDVNISSNSQGISMCVNSKTPALSTSTSTSIQPESLPDVASEARILMARDQTEYLFSPEGRQFLTAAATQCNVSVRMDFKEYGYVLVIYGLKKNQEDLQLMLLRRNQEVKRKTSEFQSQKPPKRIDVLIRFMRDGINSLAGDLGSAKTHYMRIKELEQMNTKNGYKLAERKRRLLNMILLGQAGLSNGNMHLDQLLIILKRLLEEHSGDENATPAIRNEIEEHWRVIFSPLPQPNYESLLHSYAKLDLKNRLATLNVEPALLGQQPTQQKRERERDRERMASPPPPPPVWQHDNNNKNRSPKQRALLNGKWSDQPQPPPPPPVWQHEERVQTTPVMQQQQHNNNNNNNNNNSNSNNNNNNNNRTPKPRTQPHAKLMPGQQKRQLPPPPPIWQHEEQHNNNNNNNSNNNNKNRAAKQRPQPYTRPAGPVPQQQQQQHQQYVLPCHNLQQRAPGRQQLQLQRNRPLQSECVRLLAGMERGDTRNSINTDASKPSMFWSRESLKYLDELFKITANADTLERLQRVLERSRRGQLSHNDYRAVIRLHSLMEPH